VFLARDLGTMDLKPGERRTIALPATTATTILVAGGDYDGLQLELGGRPVPGPYPAQIRRIVQGTHQVSFRWVSGPNQGKRIQGSATLVDGSVFRIVGSPQNETVTVTKLR
jgi:hypothetical protein